MPGPANAWVRDKDQIMRMRPLSVTYCSHLRPHLAPRILRCNSAPRNGVYSGVWPVCSDGCRNPSMRIRNSNEPWTVSLVGCSLRWPRTRQSRQVERPVSLLVLRCVLLLLLGAQVSKAIQTSSSPTAPSDQARSEKYALSGTVVDAVTAEPIRKALVQLHGAQQYTVFSDGDGRFQFGGLPAG